MMQPEIWPETCLNIAIDHRIQRLFAKVELRSGTSLPCKKNDALDEIISCVHSIHNRKLDEGEIDVTTRLAGPYRTIQGESTGEDTTKGITILLQQPKEKHEYHKGTAHVIRDCATLRELHNIFQTVSLRSLGISDINVVDTLPCIKPSDEKNLANQPNNKVRLQNAVSTFICSNNPTVVLCASRTPWGSLKNFKSLGVGQTMPDQEPSNRHPIRANAFHPSLVLNYYPYEPETRQLLILEVLKACKRLNGTWKEAEWMRKLRCSCEKSDAAKAGKENNSLSQKQSSMYDQGKNTNNKTIDENRLVDLICEAALSISKSNADAFSKDTDKLSIQDAYQKIVDSRISMHYSRMSLCASTFVSLNTNGLAGKRQRNLKKNLSQSTAIKSSYDSIIRKFPPLKQVNDYTLNSELETRGLYDPYFLEHTKRADEAPHLARWRSTVSDCIIRLNEAYCYDGNRVKSTLNEFSEALLDCAVRMERLLGQLLKEIESVDLS